METRLTIDVSGLQYWLSGGLLHREDGPAVLTVAGSRHWYYCGKKHRVGGAASEYSVGVRQWYQHGMLHNLDGPAHANSHNGWYEWWVDGAQYDKDSFYTHPLVVMHRFVNGSVTINQECNAHP